MSSQPSPVPVPHSAVPVWRRATRPASDRQVAGVCTGIARHLDLDPLLIRVLAVVLALSDGVGVVAYAAAWVLVPDESGSSVADRHLPGLARRRPRTIVLMVVAICLVTLPLWDSITPFGLGPVAVLAAGWWLARRASHRSGGARPPQAVTAPPVPMTPPVPMAPRAAAPTESSPVPFDPYRAEQSHRTPPVLAAAPTGRRHSWWLTLVMLVAAGVAGVAGYLLAGPHPVLLGLAAALGVVALFELVGTLWRRPRLGVPLGVAIAVCLVGAAVMPAGLPPDVVTGRSVSSTWRTVDDLPARGLMVAGADARVDASRFSTAADADVTIDVMGGNLTLVTPKDATIVVAADLHQSDLSTPGGHDARSDGTTVWRHGPASSPALTVHLRILGGSARVVSPR